MTITAAGISRSRYAAWTGSGRAVTPDSEEAQAAGRALAVADRDGAGAGCTLGQWLARWPASEDALRPSTRQGYATHIRLYLIPQLGRILLRQLTSRDVNGLLATLASRPSPTGRRLSSATVVWIHATLRTALNAAVRARLIPINPANGAELPHPRRPHPVVWTVVRTAPGSKRENVQRWRSGPSNNSRPS
ncbi:hypothetical protein AB0K16_25630 [Nonomuraea jabiensis]|uniref:hypothetical protein n=1 Tax=Nonomuraea jabiensis TaxID=882448 RepID=UPI003445E314